MDFAEKVTLSLIAMLILILSGTFLKLVWEGPSKWSSWTKAGGTVAIVLCIAAAISLLLLVVRATS